MTHLSPHQQWYRSLTDEERARLIEQSSRRINDWQDRSVQAGAARRHDAWSEEEDSLIVWSSKTAFQLALDLQRTYAQVASRRTSLRQALVGEVRPYLKAPEPFELKHVTLCACGTFDEEHEGWCPNA